MICSDIFAEAAIADDFDQHQHLSAFILWNECYCRDQDISGQLICYSNTVYQIHHFESGQLFCRVSVNTDEQIGHIAMIKFSILYKERRELLFGGQMGRFNCSFISEYWQIFVGRWTEKLHLRSSILLGSEGLRYKKLHNQLPIKDCTHAVAYTNINNTLKFTRNWKQTFITIGLNY